jgi:hypothetical protein
VNMIRPDGKQMLQLECPCCVEKNRALRDDLRQRVCRLDEFITTTPPDDPRMPDAEQTRRTFFIGAEKYEERMLYHMPSQGFA